MHYPDELADCAICPRECHVNRITGPHGWCRSDASFNISSICIHRGEEPVISGPKGICNIFFTHCNLQCIYCQNHQISGNRITGIENNWSLDLVADKIISILDQGINLVGFVSPSHNIPQMLAIINAVKSKGYSPRWVYNSNGYDKAVTLRHLEGIIDIYLPDFKYMEANLAESFSDAKNYPETAGIALKEMLRQKGTALHVDSQGVAESGIIIRHLVLPKHAENSKRVLRFIAEELSPRLHISLMSQYYPAYLATGHPELGNYLTRAEYLEVCNEMEKLGMNNGWVQEFDSNLDYRPDFRQAHPFED